eukprot:6288144-Ditylum_brightwellii.AAC.1
MDENSDGDSDDSDDSDYEYTAEENVIDEGNMLLMKIHLIHHMHGGNQEQLHLWNLGNIGIQTLMH